MALARGYAMARHRLALVVMLNFYPLANQGARGYRVCPLRKYIRNVRTYVHRLSSF